MLRMHIDAVSASVFVPSFNQSFLPSQSDAETCWGSFHVYSSPKKRRTASSLFPTLATPLIIFSVRAKWVWNCCCCLICVAFSSFGGPYWKLLYYICVKAKCNKCIIRTKYKLYSSMCVSVQLLARWDIYNNVLCTMVFLIMREWLTRSIRV